MCILMIELVWVEKYGKMGEKPHFLGNFKGWYRYQTEWYALFWTSVCILAITCSFLIRFE